MSDPVSQRLCFVHGAGFSSAEDRLREAEAVEAGIYVKKGAPVEVNIADYTYGGVMRHSLVPKQPTEEALSKPGAGGRVFRVSCCCLS